MTNKYQVILADPPWFYNNRKTGGERNDKTKFGGGARKHYSLMPDHELYGMATFINHLSDARCALFLWATMPRLDFAVDLMRVWGFKYRTSAFTWVKSTKDGSSWKNGPGFYTASNTEIVLLGTKGCGLKPTKAMVNPIIMRPPGRHSEKPVEVVERINAMYPNYKKIELFARSRMPGWDAWGNEISSIGDLSTMNSQEV